MPELTEAQPSREPIATPDDYRQTFEGFRPGQKVLQDLCARFHDKRIWVPGGLEAQRETDKRAAQQAVIGFILGQIGQTQVEAGDGNS